MANWKNLTIALLLADGCIDEEETKVIKQEIMDDYVVDEEEMQFLIGLRKSAQKTCQQFEMFFFEAFKSYLLADEEIDAGEAELIRSVLFADGKIDKNEMKFLRDVKNSAKKMHSLFHKLCEECGV